ncbi:MAG: F0F1 ATP synthase subunit B [Actinomycetota bacterium]|jgi:F-type H+-transporting ATPase subunit b
MHWSQALLLATEAGGDEPTFTDLKPVTAVWVWVAFIVTFLILSKVAWPGLAKKLEERELRIAEGLRKAEEAEERARELAQKQEQVLAEARAEAQKLLADARAAADNVKNDLMRQAQEEIGAERERAKREIGLERAKAIDELKQVTVDLTLEASARLLRRELRDEDHRRLAREVVEEVATRL